MLAVIAFLAGLALAGYGVARWFHEREDALLAEISAYYERRHRLVLGRIEEGDRALLAAYAELDRLEKHAARIARELEDTLAERKAVEQALERRTKALACAETQLGHRRLRVLSSGDMPVVEPGAWSHLEQASLKA